MKKTVSLLTAACVLVAASGCGTAADKPSADSTLTVTRITQDNTSRTADNIIEDIITYHGCYGDKADAKVDELLAELAKLDSRQGALWTDIMKYWNYANTGLTVNIDRLPDDLPTGDNLALAVLGFELNDDGTMQDELIGRLTVALNCAKQYPNAFVICTGGGTAKNNPDVTEGGLMGEWMLGHGLDPERLIVENKSLTTAENASNSYDIILKDYPQIDSIVVISSNYHIAWGSLLFEAAFLKSASEKQTRYLELLLQNRERYLSVERDTALGDRRYAANGR